MAAQQLQAHPSNTPPSPPKISINASHYSMLLNNDANGLWDELDEGSDFSNLVWESDNSTILHLAASVGQLYLIDKIIQQPCQHLLRVPNTKDDLPIHVAARSCQFEAVKRLVFLADRFNEISLLERTNKDSNTVLHIALENQQEKMAKFLFEKYPKTFYYLNLQGFSPLFLAIKAEFWDLVKSMLSEAIVDEFPEALAQLLEGKSVVHAAIIAKRKDILEMMVKGYRELLYEKTDEMGRKPLSYAAYTGFLDGVQYIIDEFRNQAYKIDETGSFPIHWACSGGDIKIVKEFFSRLPMKARLTLNNKGQNILHVAAANGRAEVVKHILQQPELEMMINMKDEDGNTPLHLASKRKHPKVVYDFTWDDRVNLTLQNKDGLTALDIAEDYGDQIPSFKERLTWLSLKYAGVPRAPEFHCLNINIIEPANMTMNSNIINAQHTFVNNQNGPPTFMLLNQQSNLGRSHPNNNKPKNKYKQRIHTLLVVATLVATITFASGFTVPGGYSNNKPDEGMATLVHECAFQVFVISNTIAMYSATLAMVTLIWAQLEDLRLVLLSLDFALPLLGVSLAMMSVAFMAGLYVVLHTLVFWLGLVVLVMGGMFLGALLVFFIPLYSPRSCSKNKILRNICHVPFTLMLLACEKVNGGK
ncbi:protein ACCELERATED CELL DEATH 6-like [Chenopodium quinoa]|uniref:PGG domain-containing protein n=1 Tax=Chenopodium quinoa TaxID=63459 RepID=A0A803KVY6_CHEQI|nr:protein ACCELERATED CELL DEATH 6-like [Chenopodium quinoa]